LKHKAALLFILIAVFLFSYNYTLNDNQTEKIQRSDDRIVFRLAESYSAQHPSAQAAQRFADLVYERTDGRIQIKVYYDGQLGSDPEVLEQVQFGGIALARVNLSELSNASPILQQYIAPYKYSSPDEMINFFNNGSADIAQKIQLEKLNPLVWYYPDIRCFYNNKRVISKSGDISGLKLKTTTSVIMMNIVQQLGANPVNILAGDTFKSLNSGFIDGGETTLCEFVHSDFLSVVPFVTLSDYIYLPDTIVASSVSLSQISRDDQKLLERCAVETFTFQKELMLKSQENAIKIIESQKVFLPKQPEFESSMRKIFTSEQAEVTEK